MYRQLLRLVVVCGVFVAWHSSRAEDPKPQEERFDLLVREDFFAGFSGDKAALARGLKLCEETLAKNPKHAEALVWRGAARVFLSGEYFEKEQQAQGMKFFTDGLKDMDDAVALDPTNAGVRIPRAAVLLPAARATPPVFGKQLAAKALDDFRTIEKLQKDDLDKLGTHPRGELRMGLADTYRLLGKFEESNEQLRAIVKELPNTRYSKRAEEWLAAKPDAKLVHNCIGCHVK